MDSAPTFKAACVQLRSGLDRRENVRDALALIDEAAGAGAQFIATPEMTNLVDRKKERFLADLPGEEGLDEINAFAEAAARHGSWLLIGSLGVGLGDKNGALRAANRSYLFSPHGEIAARYDKLHMFDVSLPNGESWKESNVYDAGENAIIVKTGIGVFGLTICYDLRFPRLYRELAQAGAEIFCIPAAFTKQTGEAHWETLLRARAIENGAFVIAPAQGGRHEDGRETYGHSMIIGPWGDILARSESDAPGVILAEIGVSRAHEARQRIPNLSLEQKFKTSILTV